MAILDQRHFPWIVALASLCVAGCNQAQPVETAIESTNVSANTPAAASPTGPRAAASSSGRGGAGGAAADGGRAGTATSSARSTGSGGASGSVTVSAGASGSVAASPDAAAARGASGAAAVTGASGAAAATGASGASAAIPDGSVDAGTCAVRAGTAAAAGFVGDWTPGTYPDDFTSASGGKYLTISGLPNQGGMDREYAVHVPLGYDKGTPLPALFCLHAFSMNALSFCVDMAGWPAKADKEKFVVIMPNGYQNSWNIGEGCGAALLPVHTEGIDDVGFVRGVYSMRSANT